MADVLAVPLSKVTELLGYDDAITAMAIAMEEVALAQALVMIHGPDHGARRYVETGGCLRTGPGGEVVLLWVPGMRPRL